MRWHPDALFVTTLVFGLSGPVRAVDNDATAIVDKAIRALGGEDKLSKVRAVSWKATGTIHVGDEESEFNTQAIRQGLDRYRTEFEGVFNGIRVKGLTVLNGDKGWRKFGELATELDKDAVAHTKRTVYLQAIPVTVVSLKDKGFKVDAAGDEMIGGRPAAGIKVTCPDGKDFLLYFDKENGLPVKQVAKVIGFLGEEAVEETTFADYKELAGIKKATRIVVKRDGETFLKQEVVEFRILDTVVPDTFAEPK